MSKWMRRFGGNSPSAPVAVVTSPGDHHTGPAATDTPSSAAVDAMNGSMPASSPQAPAQSQATSGGGSNVNGASVPNVAPPPSYYNSSSNYKDGSSRSVRSRSGVSSAAYASYGQNHTGGSQRQMQHDGQQTNNGEEMAVQQNSKSQNTQRELNRAADPGGANVSSGRRSNSLGPASRGKQQGREDVSQSPAPGQGNYNDYSKGGFVPPPSSTPQDRSDPSYNSNSGQSQQRRPAYLLHRDLVIGKGSYGQVCIASRGEAEGGRSGKRKKFACKCVMLRSDPKYIAKLQEEVNVLRELRGHENVIRLYDVFCVDNELFIITELGRGGDLFHLLTTHPKHGVTEAYAAKTVAQMLSAVAFLHSRNICHRDLKLENWVLESGKDVWSPLKLIDFGLSTHFTPGHRLSRVVGSSYYVAPEVLKKSYTEACDLWSLGVIVYMLLSGAPPFYGRTDEAIKASIVNGEYTFPHELFRDVSDDAMAFVSTLLSYNTEYRYTADQALTHPWLSANCDPEILRRAKEGAQGRHANEQQPEPMQM